MARFPEINANAYCSARGGVEALMMAANETDNLQWRLVLCDHLIALVAEATHLKAQTTEALAKTEINANARIFYLTEAQHLRKV